MSERPEMDDLGDLEPGLAQQMREAAADRKRESEKIRQAAQAEERLELERSMDRKLSEIVERLRRRM